MKITAIISRNISCARTLCRLTLAMSIGFGLTPAHAQELPASPPPENPQPRSSPRVFEDDQVKILIPPGWTILEGDPAAAQPFLRVGRHVQLQKIGYTLTLAYDTKPATGSTGDRFTQVFSIPWLAPAQPPPAATAQGNRMAEVGRMEGCAFSLRRNQQPAGTSLLFIGFSMDTADSRVRGNCAIPTDVGPRWFAGFFTVQNGGYFLRSRGSACFSKAYTLTSQARTADALPAPNDRALRDIIAEAGRIVNFIQYKRCALAVAPN